ncbi:MAG: OmpA family protein [Saprospiraceae bacterium]
MRQIIGLLIFCLAVGSFQSCVSKKKFDELQAAKDASDKALAETQQQVKNLQDENTNLKSTMEAEKTRMNNEIATIRKDLDATKGQMAQVQEKLNMTQQELDNIKKEINGIFDAYKTSGLTLEERDGRLYVVTEPVTYRSGSASLSRAERNALAELANTLKNNPKLDILIEGHTDSQKYPRGAGYDNWNLSVDRAMSVARELLKRGVSADQIAVVGRGDTLPMEDNGTAAGRAKNRRTVVAPEINAGALIKAAGGNTGSN